MRRKNSKRFPRAVIRDLASDISLLMDSNEGRLLAMGIMEEIPYDLRPQILESLSSFHKPEIADFFRLVRTEFENELAENCERALGKLSLAGIDLNSRSEEPRRFLTAYASRTRHLGQVSLDVAYTNHLLSHEVEVESYFLTSHSDGIQTFYVAERMPIDDFMNDHLMNDDMIPVNRNEVCYLVQEAYRQNLASMTPPALGRFLYGQYLGGQGLKSTRDQRALIRRLTPHLTPAELVNSFFYAARYGDTAYMNAVCENGGEEFSSIAELVDSRNLLLEARVEREVVEGNLAMLYATTITTSDDEVFRSRYTLGLIRKGSRWVINHINRYGYERMAEGDPDNPFYMPVYCSVFQVLDSDGLVDAIDRFDDVRQIGELPYGVHLRLPGYDNEVEKGVTFMTGVMADIVLNGDELVVISSDKDSIGMVGDTLCQGGAVAFVSEHETEIVNAYAYVSGGYATFEDVLNMEGQPGEDTLKFVSINYVSSRPEKVKQKLSELELRHFALPDCEAFYQVEERDDGRTLVTEFLVSDCWVSISTFSDQELSGVREWFENGMGGSLEFDGIQVREGGIFGILTPEVRRAAPELEGFLKTVYLERWYTTRQSRLSGLCPREAVASAEGRRMLWNCVKEMRSRQKSGRQGGYLSWIDFAARIGFHTRA